jgi:choline-glycine betaine transporter
LNEKVNSRPFDPMIFWVSASITVAFVVWSLVFPENMNTVINGIFGWTTRFWGWLYLVTAFLLVLACFALMGNTYGVESAIFAIAQHLPLSGLLAVCPIFLITTFFLTSANSAAVSLAMFVSGHETPGRNLRAFCGASPWAPWPQCWPGAAASRPSRRRPSQRPFP